MNFDSSWRGLPYFPRAATKADTDELIKKHSWKVEPNMDDAECVVMTIDTMDTFFSYAVFAWMKDDAVYMLECGRKERLTEAEDSLEDILQHKQYNGVPILFAVIDQRRP